MVKERLKDYPQIVDPFMDFEATRQHFRKATCNYAISKSRLDNGKVVVYLHQQRETDKVISVPQGFGNICEQGIIICGYKAREKGILGFLKGSKIRPILLTERESVESELLQKFGKEKPAYVYFWSTF